MPAFSPPPFKSKVLKYFFNQNSLPFCEIPLTENSGKYVTGKHYAFRLLLFIQSLL